MTQPAATPRSHDDVEAIFEQLKQGVGREWVTNDNVDRLVNIAQREGHQMVELLLREWRSSCGEDAERLTQRQVNPRDVGAASDSSTTTAGSHRAGSCIISRARARAASG